jgi:hypothetical protein
MRGAHGAGPGAFGRGLTDSWVEPGGEVTGEK